MSDWSVVVTEGQQIWNAKVYGPFRTEEVAQAVARGFSNSGSPSGKNATAIRMETP